MELHPSQKKLLEYLKRTSSLEGVSIRSIAREIGLTNPQNVLHHLKQLEKKGFLRRNPSDPDQFEVLKDPIDDVVYVNVYGFANCGNDSDCFSSGNLEDRIALPTRVFGMVNGKDVFATKARGDSMEPEIYEGDIVIFSRQNEFRDGEIALVVDGGVAKIKQLSRQSGQTVLVSKNSHYLPKIVTGNDDFRILGSIVGVIRNTFVYS